VRSDLGKTISSPRRSAHRAHYLAPIDRIRAEERLLRLQFGAEYVAYSSRTSRLIPSVY
jgi:hypothetical protein